MREAVPPLDTAPLDAAREPAALDAATEPASLDAQMEPAPRPVARHRSRPGPRALARVKSAATPPRAHRRRPAPERAEPPQIGTALIDRAPEEPRSAEGVSPPRVVTRVAALPRVLLDTVAWGGFAAVVALIVIALSDVGVGSAALWAVGLSGIVVLAVAVIAVTGAHLDNLNHTDAGAARPD